MSITKESPLYGKIVVATGKLEHYTRDGIQNKLLQIGAIPASSVTKKTNYLIVGEKAGSKLTKAQQLGVPTLTEEEFEEFLRYHMATCERMDLMGASGHTVDILSVQK